MECKRTSILILFLYQCKLCTMSWFILFSLVWHVLRVNAVCTPPIITVRGMYVEPDQAQYDEISILSIQCESSYIHDGFYTSLCYRGVWNPDPSETACRAPCPVPAVDSDVQHFDKATKISESVQYIHGTNIRYKCVQNKGVFEGTKTAKCKDGIWDPPEVPICRDKCFAPANVLPVKPLAYKHGSTIFFAGCIDGTVSNGITSATCRDGEWSDDVICSVPSETTAKATTEKLVTTGLTTFGVPDCLYPDLGTQSAFLLPYQLRGYKNLDTVYFYCNETIPYVSQASICYGGIWLPSIPTKICDDPCQVPVADGMAYSKLSGHTDGVILTHGSRVSFSCERGDPGPTTSTCNDGVWEPPILCTDAITTFTYTTTIVSKPLAESTQPNSFTSTETYTSIYTTIITESQPSTTDFLSEYTTNSMSTIENTHLTTLHTDSGISTAERSTTDTIMYTTIEDLMTSKQTEYVTGTEKTTANPPVQTPRSQRTDLTYLPVLTELGTQTDLATETFETSSTHRTSTHDPINSVLSSTHETPSDSTFDVTIMTETRLYTTDVPELTTGEMYSSLKMTSSDIYSEGLTSPSTAESRTKQVTTEPTTYSVTSPTYSKTPDVTNLPQSTKLVTQTITMTEDFHTTIFSTIEQTSITNFPLTTGDITTKDSKTTKRTESMPKTPVPSLKTTRSKSTDFTSLPPITELVPLTTGDIPTEKTKTSTPNTRYKTTESTSLPQITELETFAMTETVTTASFPTNKQSSFPSRATDIHTIENETSLGVSSSQFRDSTSLPQLTELGTNTIAITDIYPTDLQTSQQWTESSLPLTTEGLLTYDTSHFTQTTGDPKTPTDSVLKSSTTRTEGVTSQELLNDISTSTKQYDGTTLVNAMTSDATSTLTSPTSETLDMTSKYKTRHSSTTIADKTSLLTDTGQEALSEATSGSSISVTNQQPSTLEKDTSTTEYATEEVSLPFQTNLKTIRVTDGISLTPTTPFSTSPTYVTDDLTYLFTTEAPASTSIDMATGKLTSEVTPSSTEQALITYFITAEQTPTADIVTTDEKLTTDSFTTEQALITYFITVEQTPTADITATQKSTSDIVTTDEKLTTDIFTTEQALITDFITAEQTPTADITTTHKSTSDIITTGRTPTADIFTTEEALITDFITAEQTSTADITTTQKSTSDIVTSGRTPTADIFTTEQASTTDFITTELTPTTDITATTLKPTTNIITIEQKSTTDVITTDEKITTYITTTEQTLTTNTTTTVQTPTSNIVTKEQTSSTDSFRTEQALVTYFITAEQTLTADITTTQKSTSDIITTGRTPTTDIFTTEQALITYFNTAEQTPTPDITTTQKSTSDIITTGRTPTTDIFTTEQALITDFITAEQTPTPDITTTQKSTSDIVTTDEKLTTDIFTTEQALITYFITAEQTPTADITTTQKSTSDIVTTGRTPTTDIFARTRKPTTSIITIEQKPTTDVITTDEKLTTDIITTGQTLTTNTIITEQIPAVDITTTHKPTSDIVTTERIPTRDITAKTQKSTTDITTTTQKPTTDFVTTGRTPTTDIITTEQASTTDIITTEETPATDIPSTTLHHTTEFTTTRQKFTSNIITIEQKPTTDVITTDNKLTTDIITPEQKLTSYTITTEQTPTRDITTTQRPTADIVTKEDTSTTDFITTGQTPTADIIKTEKIPTTYITAIDITTIPLKPTTNIITKEQNPKTGIATIKNKPTTYILTSEQKTLTNIITTEWIPTTDTKPKPTTEQKHTKDTTSTEHNPTTLDSASEDAALTSESSTLSSILSTHKETLPPHPGTILATDVTTIFSSTTQKKMNSNPTHVVTTRHEPCSSRTHHTKLLQTTEPPEPINEETLAIILGSLGGVAFLLGLVACCMCCLWLAILRSRPGRRRRDSALGDDLEPPVRSPGIIYNPFFINHEPSEKTTITTLPESRISTY